MSITLKAAQNVVKDILKANLVSNIVGSPGIGKSDIIKQVAAMFNLKVIDHRLAQSDPTDLSGFPTLNEDRSRCHYAPPITFPLVGDKLPVKTPAVYEEIAGEVEPGVIGMVRGKLITPEILYDGWLLFLDELTSAPQMVQAAAYKIILDRQVGEHDLHDKVRIVSAGNKVTDKAIVNRMSTALQSRVITIEVEVDVEDWLDWAAKAGIDDRVIAYIRFKPDQLHKFNPDHQDLTFPCPRTWEFASKLLKVWGKVSMEHLHVLAGTVSKGAASELIAFCHVYQSLPSIHELRTNPSTVTINTGKHDVLHAISSLIGANYDKDNAEAFITVLQRLPIEFRVIAVQNTLLRDETLRTTEPHMKKWISENAAELY